MFLDKFLKRPLLFFVFMFAALPLWANAGLPMLFMVYPGFLTALIPVVLIEFFCLKGSFKDCSLKKLFFWRIGRESYFNFAWSSAYLACSRCGANGARRRQGLRA